MTDPLIAALAAAASSDAELATATRLSGAVGAAERTAAARATLALPWSDGMPAVAERTLATLARWDAAAALGALLANGVGATACAASGGAWWVPRWLADAAAHRSDAVPVVAATRRIVPATWPVPTAQVLIEPGGDPARIAARLLGRRPLRADEPAVDDERWPRAWSGPLVPVADVAALARRLQRDPTDGMRALLGGPPLAMAMAAVAGLAVATAAREGAAWRGRAAAGLPLATAGDGIALLPGWLQALLVALGLDAAGAPHDATAAVERRWIVDVGGDVLGEGADELHLPPPAAARIVRALPLPWARVPRLGRERAA